MSTRVTCPIVPVFLCVAAGCLSPQQVPGCCMAISHCLKDRTPGTAATTAGQLIEAATLTLYTLTLIWNIKDMHFHFTSYFHNQMAEGVVILPHARESLTYLIQSALQLMITWWPKAPRHQQEYQPSLPGIIWASQGQGWNLNMPHQITQNLSGH